MKKIYSYVLMAAMLLVGTNAWADNFSGTTRAELQAAINDAADGTTITLQNNVTLDGPVWLGTENLTDDAKSITLDLNGHNVTMASTGAAYMFVLSHGELLVHNSSATTSNILLTGSANASSQIFSVYGSYKSSRWNPDGTEATGEAINTRTSGYFSHLVIGERILVAAAEGCLGAGVVVDQLNNGSSPARTAASLSSKTINYFTNLHSSSGYAYGARVDVFGDINIGGINDGKERKAYGIKTNGNLSSPLAGNVINLNATTAEMNKTSNEYLKNYDANKEGHKLDTLDAAFVYVHSNSNITTNANSTRSAALYCSGYAKWLVEGNCEGGYGIYASSGEISIHDANISSSAESYTAPSGGNGATGSGTAIVINSKSSYPGDISVDISGNTHVEASNGYAIEETVTSAPDTKVDNLTISGGTFAGGEVPDPNNPGDTMQGTISISVETAESVDEGSTSIVVAGGVTIEGGESSVTYGNEGNLGDIIDGESSYMTTVTDPETGKQTVVVSSGSEPVVVPNEFDINLFAGGSDVNLSDDALVNKNQVFNSALNKMYINTLQINPSTTDVTLTITSGKTIQAKNIVLGYKGKIIVEPGAQLIVAGGEGVVSMIPENLVLKSSVTEQAKFLIDPAIDVNAHPKATVEFISTKSYYVDGEHHQWERFALPTWKAVTSVECATPGLVADIQEFGAKGWKSLGFITGGTPYAGASQMDMPFGAYNLLVNSATPTDAIYRFTGELAGNMDANLTLDHEFTPFANSYMADVDLWELLGRLEGDEDVTPTVYVNTPLGSGSGFAWTAVDKEWFDVTKLAPLQGFYLYNEVMAIRGSAIDYEEMVWNPAMNPSPAPARRAMKSNDNTAKLRIVVTNAKGVKDEVKMTERATNWNNAPKCLNDDVNFYAHADENKLTIVTAENLENTYLGFSTVNGGEFTISFQNVEGREFDILDLDTNIATAVEEGNTYTFTAGANTNSDYRFKLVDPRKVATDIDAISAEKSGAQGIYTIMGQYVGEMNIWNTLPAGVYVVDGTKRVK